MTLSPRSSPRLLPDHQHLLTLLHQQMRCKSNLSLPQWNLRRPRQAGDLRRPRSVYTPVLGAGGTSRCWTLGTREITHASTRRSTPVQPAFEGFRHRTPVTHGLRSAEYPAWAPRKVDQRRLRDVILEILESRVQSAIPPCLEGLRLILWMLRLPMPSPLQVMRPTAYRLQ